MVYEHDEAKGGNSEQQQFKDAHDRIFEAALMSGQDYLNSKVKQVPKQYSLYYKLDSKKVDLDDLVYEYQEFSITDNLLC